MFSDPYTGARFAVPCNLTASIEQSRIYCEAVGLSGAHDESFWFHLQKLVDAAIVYREMGNNWTHFVRDAIKTGRLTPPVRSYSYRKTVGTISLLSFAGLAILIGAPVRAGVACQMPQGGVVDCRHYLDSRTNVDDARRDLVQQENLARSIRRRQIDVTTDANGSEAKREGGDK